MDEVSSAPSLLNTGQSFHVNTGSTPVHSLPVLATIERGGRQAQPTRPAHTMCLEVRSPGPAHTMCLEVWSPGPAHTMCLEVRSLGEVGFDGALVDLACPASRQLTVPDDDRLRVLVPCQAGAQVCPQGLDVQRTPCARQSGRVRQDHMEGESRTHTHRYTQIRIHIHARAHGGAVSRA